MDNIVFDGLFHVLDTPVEITGIFNEMVRRSCPGGIPRTDDYRNFMESTEKEFGEDFFKETRSVKWFHWDGHNPFALKVLWEHDHLPYDGPLKSVGSQDYDEEGNYGNCTLHYALEGEHEGTMVEFVNGQPMIVTSSTPKLLAYWFETC